MATNTVTYIPVLVVRVVKFMGLWWAGDVAWVC